MFYILTRGQSWYSFVPDGDTVSIRQHDSKRLHERRLPIQEARKFYAELLSFGYER